MMKDPDSFIMAASKQTEQNKEICRRFFEELHNQHNVTIIDELVAPDVVSHDPFPGQLPGSEGLKNTMQMFWTGLPDLHVEIKDMLAENDRVMTRLNVKGTHTGTFLESAPTNNAVMYDEVIILRIANGKIVEHWAVADALSLMQGVGAVAH
jgi:predicted ester cyclase